MKKDGLGIFLAGMATGVACFAGGLITGLIMTGAADDCEDCDGCDGCDGCEGCDDWAEDGDNDMGDFDWDDDDDFEGKGSADESIFEDEEPSKDAKSGVKGDAD